MLVVFHVIVAKCGHEIGVVCLVCVQIELAASLPTFFHAVGHKVFKQCFLVCTECICKIRVKLQVILIIVDGLILGKLLGKRRVCKDALLYCEAKFVIVSVLPSIYVTTAFSTAM